MTVPMLHDTVQRSYSPAPETHDVTYMFNISGWLDKHIEPLKNHVYPHAFKFFRGEDNQGKMVYKNWAQDDIWKPANKPPIQLLKSTPDGLPELIRPKLGGRTPVDLLELADKVKASSHRMTDEEVAWWSNFAADEKSNRAMWDKMTPKQVKDLGKTKWPMSIIKKFKDTEVAPTESEEEKRQRNELKRLLEKEEHFPPVSKKQTCVQLILKIIHSTSHTKHFFPCILR